MNAQPVKEPLEKPWWASFGFWLFAGCFAATMTFAWHERVALLRAYRLYMPGAKKTGMSLLKEARGLTGRPTFASEEDDGLPEQPASLKLSAPVDPSRRFAKTDPGARVSSSARGRRMMRDVRGRGRESAAEVKEVRQFMGAVQGTHEEELPFWKTDLGIGIQISLGISFFFFCLGSVMMRYRPRGERKL